MDTNMNDIYYLRCVSDHDCNDGDICTADACVGRCCVHTLSGFCETQSTAKAMAGMRVTVPNAPGTD